MAIFPVEVTMSDTAAARGLTLRQRREMGLTIGNLTRATRQCIESGSVDKTDAPEVIAAAVAAQLVVENPKAFADPSVDWDSILAFIEKLIPIIMTLIALF